MTDDMKYSSDISTDAAEMHGIPDEAEKDKVKEIAGASISDEKLSLFQEKLMSLDTMRQDQKNQLLGEMANEVKMLQPPPSEKELTEVKEIAGASISDEKLSLFQEKLMSLDTMRQDQKNQLLGEMANEVKMLQPPPSEELTDDMKYSHTDVADMNQVYYLLNRKILI
uniref:Uncharacterized protein n=1 Tax=Octactis speculum TaxID=3111310 RepID=A0A7S2G711_9STRA